MAIIAVEGFDAYNGVTNTSTAVGILSRWASESTSALATVAGRFGGQALQCRDANRPTYLPLGTTYTSGCVGFAISIPVPPGDTYPFVGVGVGAAGESATSQFNLGFNGSNIVLRRGGTVLATSTATFPFGVWNYIEVEFVISDTVGEVRVYFNNDPTPIISVSGVDTRYQADAGFNAVGFNMAAGASIYTSIDDVYITDTPNRLGEQRVLTTYVDADSAPSDWSASTPGADPYTMLNEVLCDGDTTYIYSGTAGESAVFSTQNPSITLTSVEAVQIGGFARKTDTGVRGIQLQYVNGGGSTYNSSESILGTGYSRPVNLLATNPGTGLAWTAAELNAMRIGVRIST